jgi:phytanoyl-CoA hydroxylase
MEKIDDQNGCLVVCPGTHKGQLLEHGYPEWEGKVNKAYYGVKNMDADTNRIHLPMEAGDTVFFHPLLVHGSGWNKTKSNYRKAISGHYASADCHFIEVKGTLQEELANEIEEVAKKRLPRGVTISYEDIWRLKSRLVHGKDGKFAE